MVFIISNKNTIKEAPSGCAAPKQGGCQCCPEHLSETWSNLTRDREQRIRQSSVSVDLRGLLLGDSKYDV